ncbi:MAG TPA: hypothetical protein VFG98_10620, partial [Intrasporangium sp.]|nr:hypothetical protein [Intrasporangium sp.]
ALVTVGPGLVESSMNKLEPVPLPEVSPQARALHQRLHVVDLHADTLMWDRDLLERADRGHVDLPRLREGHVALQVFSSVSKSPKGQNYESNTGDTDNITLLTMVQLQPPRTWGSLLQRSLHHAEKLEQVAVPHQRVGVQVDDVQSLVQGSRLRTHLGQGDGLELVHRALDEPGPDGDQCCPRTDDHDAEGGEAAPQP